MKVDEFLSEYAGLDLESDEYIEAVRCLSDMFLGNGEILNPDEDISSEYSGLVDWVGEGKLFLEAFGEYRKINSESAERFLVGAGIQPSELVDSLKDLEDFFDLDSIEPDTDIYPYIEDFFDGNKEKAMRDFLNMFRR